MPMTYTYSEGLQILRDTRAIIFQRETISKEELTREMTIAYEYVRRVEYEDPDSSRRAALAFLLEELENDIKRFHPGYKRMPRILPYDKWRHHKTADGFEWRDDERDIRIGCSWSILSAHIDGREYCFGEMDSERYQHEGAENLIRIIDAIAKR